MPQVYVRGTNANRAAGDEAWSVTTEARTQSGADMQARDVWSRAAWRSARQRKGYAV